MKINLKTLVRWKVYLDRSRVYVASVQFIFIGVILAKSLGWDVSILEALIMAIVFTGLAMIVGYYDMKLGVRSEEFRNLSESNPLMMEILSRLEHRRQPDLSYKGEDLSHVGLATKRQILGLTLRQVSSLTGISSSTISRIEQGKECKLSNLTKLIKFYESPENAVKIAVTTAVEQELFKGNGAAPTWRGTQDGFAPDVSELTQE